MCVTVCTMPPKAIRPDALIAGVLLIVIAALLWSLDGAFLRPKLFSITPALVVFLEHACGLVLLVPFFVIHWRALKTIRAKTWAAIGWVALFGGALGTTFFTKALFLTGFTDVSVVILLQKFQPIFAIILAVIFLRERFPKRFYLYALLALVSGYFVTFKNWDAVSALWSTAGLVALFSLLAAFSWGSSTVFGRYSVQDVPHGLLAALRFGITAAIMIVPAFWIAGGSIGEVSSGSWIIFAVIALTSGSTAMFLYYRGLANTPASIAALTELAWPVSAVFFDYLLNGNVLAWSQTAGALVLVAVVAKLSYDMRSRVIIGRVEKGLGRGRGLGVATANLPAAAADGLPQGLYTCDVTLPGGCFEGLVYWGWNSLRNTDTLEVYLFDFEGDLYGTELVVHTKQYLRLLKNFFYGFFGHRYD